MFWPDLFLVSGWLELLAGRSVIVYLVFRPSIERVSHSTRTALWPPHWMTILGWCHPPRRVGAGIRWSISHLFHSSPSKWWVRTWTPFLSQSPINYLFSLLLWSQAMLAVLLGVQNRHRASVPPGRHSTSWWTLAFSMNIKSSPGFQKWTGHFPASQTPGFQARLSLQCAFPVESWVWWAQSHCRQRPVPALPSPSSGRWRELWVEKSLLQEIAMLFLFPLMAKTRESNIFQGERKKEHKSGWTNAQFLLSKWRDKVIDAGAEDFIPVLSKWPPVRWHPLTGSFSRGGNRV